MDYIKILDMIQDKIKLLEICRDKLKQRGEDKANTITAYDKALAIVLIKLKNGHEFELDGNKIINPPASIMIKIANGLCWKESLEMNVADNNYKSLVTYIDTIQSEMNALQSINRHLD